MTDYTKYATLSQKNSGYDAGLRSYMLGVYNYMGLALLLTAITATMTLYFPPLTNLMFTVNANGGMSNTLFGTIVMFAPLGIALYFFMGFAKITFDRAKLLFWVYAGLNGMSLSSLGFIYTGESIARTFFICASLFGAMSLYGYTTKKDLTSFGSFLIMGLMGIIIAGLANLFFASAAISFVTSLLGVGIFMGLIAWDTQKLKAIYYNAGSSGEFAQKLSLMGAFNLYLDFINLFIYLLRFFGNKRDA